MKRWLPFVFILSILLGSTGQVFLSRLCIKWQKRAFRSYTIQNHTGKLRQMSVFPSALYKNTKHIRWLERNKEIEINGQRYDIISSSLKNGVTTFYILEDIRENTLLCFGLKQARQQNKALHYIQLLLSMQYLQNHHTISLNSPVLRYFSNALQDIQIVYHNGFRNDLNRPPAMMS